MDYHSAMFLMRLVVVVGSIGLIVVMGMFTWATWQIMLLRNEQDQRAHDDTESGE